MNTLDWSVVAFYITGMVLLSWYLGRKQSDMQDYYLGGNDLSWWAIGISTMATQCSTNSLLGAPAFIITTGPTQNTRPQSGCSLSKRFKGAVTRPFSPREPSSVVI